MSHELMNNENARNDIDKKFNQANEFLDKTVNLSSNIENITNAIAESEARIVEAQIQREIELKKVERDEKFLENDLRKAEIIGAAIKRQFDERDREYTNCEKIIDKGLEENDLEKIKLGLGVMANTVTKSPLENLNILGKPLLSNAIESDEDSIIEI